MIQINEDQETVEPFSFNLVPFIILYFVMIWFGLFPSALTGYFYFYYFPFSFDPLYLLFLIPLFLGLYGIALLASLISTKLGIWFVQKRLTPPIPASYPLSMQNPHVRAWVLKGNIKNFGRWLFYFPHWDFLRAIWLRQMGVKIGKKVKLGRYVIDDDFIEIGDNTFMAQESIVSGHLMDQTTITINPTKVGKNCIFEHVTGTVGTVIGDNSIFKSGTMAMKGNNCHGNAIYQGLPIKKVGESSNLSMQDIEQIKRNIHKIDNTNFVKEKNSAIKINEKKLFLMKLVIFLTGTALGLITPIAFYYIFNSVFSWSNHLLNILILAIIPPFFLIALGWFAAGVVGAVKLFLLYYDRKAEIPEGIYDLDDPKVKIFKIKYCLRLFGLRLFQGTPFKIGSTLALRVWGNAKIGKKNVKLDDAMVDPQYIEIGDRTQVSSGARIHTHSIIDGKLSIKRVKIGNNVIVGSYAHINHGVEIPDDSIIAVGAWMKENQKCEHPALWIGNPAREFPLSILTKSARLEGKYID